MTFSLSLLDSDSNIRLSILESMKQILDKALIRTLSSIEPKTRVLLRSALRNEPEYYSLISGDLRKEFGIENVSNVDIAIDNMVNAMNFIVDKPRSSNVGISGGIKIEIIPTNLAGIIDDQSAYVVDNIRGYSLPWLEWLLTKGSSIIIRGFDVKYGANPRSRSGDAIMISSQSNWRVPSQFSGTLSNNWITRALSQIEKPIEKMLQQELVRSI